MNQISIDKLKVSTNLFELNQVETFGINSHNKQQNQPISTNSCCLLSNGSPIQAQNIYVHSEKLPYHLNIKKSIKGIPTAWIVFNPNKIDKDIYKTILRIDDDLKTNHKFEFDFASSILSRLDIAGDSEMKYLAKFYAEPKKHLAKSRYGKDIKEYPNSLLYSTTKWQVCDYDKGKKNQIDDGVKNASSSNFLRSELRLMTPEYVLKHTGFNNLETIFELNTNDLQSIYVNTQNKFLQELKSNPKPIEDISNVLDIMPELMQIRNKKERILFFITSSLDNANTLNLRHTYYEALNEYIELQEWTSKQAKSNFKNRELKVLDDMLRQTNSMQNQRSKNIDQSLINRIQEYQLKFLTA
jgi:hypothetical protein